MELGNKSDFEYHRTHDKVLRGVTAYVEVWSGNENRCECVKTQLKKLGAQVEERFSAKVTHVVFSEGSLTTYKKAKKRNIPLLSVLWIEESKRLVKRACEDTYRAQHLESYEEPDIFSAPPAKRPRHTQPFRRTCKKKKTIIKKENESIEMYFNPEIFNENAALVKDGIIGTLEHVSGKTFSSIQESEIFPCSQMTAEINEPLTKKLYNRFLAEIREDTEEGNTASRYSCPTVLGHDEPSESSGFKNPTADVQELTSSETNVCVNRCSNRAQIPITFFFKATAASARLSSIVFTGLEFDEVELLTSIVQKIGGFQVDKTVSASCKHVVCKYPPKRTMNVLRGIARGCWILSKEWVLKSLDSNKWLSEEEFELNYFLPAIKKVRVARENSQTSVFRHHLFTGMGPFYVGPSCHSPPASNIKELLLLCGGYVVPCMRAAKVVVVGQGKTVSVSVRCSRDQKFVTEKWVLDSISEDSVCPFAPPYLVSTCAGRKST